jgi:hypothetical protein
LIPQSAISQTASAAELAPEVVEGRLAASIVSVADLRVEDKSRMHALMRKYYEAVTEEAFLADLDRKDAVILLRDAEGIQGFSTLVSMQATVDGRAVRGVFSGDTVIEKKYWGQRALGKAFLRYMFIEKLKRPFSPLYWLLITKGYKTYLMMANNFDEHFPRYEAKTPGDSKAIADAFYRELFLECYDPATGLIRFPSKSCRLKTGVAEISDELKAGNPRVAFFERANPEWREGVELACLARMKLSMPFRYAVKAFFDGRRLKIQ